MERVKRLCPACGAANALERDRCRACGAEMRSDLPVPAGERLPVPWKEVGTSLAVGAAALAMRGGLRLARHLLERRAARALEVRRSRRASDPAGRWLARRGEREVDAGRRPQIRVWGRRVRGRWARGGERDWEVEEFYWEGERG